MRLRPGISSISTRVHTTNALGWARLAPREMSRLCANLGDTVSVTCSTSPAVLTKSYRTIQNISVTYDGSGADPIVFSKLHGNNIDGLPLTNVPARFPGGTGAGLSWNIADSDSLTITGSNLPYLSNDRFTRRRGFSLYASNLTFGGPNPGTGESDLGEPCSSATHLEDGLASFGHESDYYREYAARRMLI